MGYDPYWPTCLASINVLCVPITAISSSRFNEIYQALRRVTQVELIDLGDGGGLGNGMHSSALQRHSILTISEKSSIPPTSEKEQLSSTSPEKLARTGYSAFLWSQMAVLRLSLASTTSGIVMPALPTCRISKVASSQSSQAHKAHRPAKCLPLGRHPLPQTALL